MSPVVSHGEHYNRDVLRSSFGVMFKYVASAKLVSDEYKQMFHVDLPPLDLIEKLEGPLVRCKVKTRGDEWIYTYTGLSCGDHVPYNEFLSTLHNDYVNKLNTTINKMYNLFVPHDGKDNKFARRALFGFLGTGLSYLTGLVTHDNLNDLKQTIIQIMSETSDLSGTLNNQLSDLSSMIKLSNVRINNVVNHIHDQNQVLLDMTIAHDRSLHSLANFTLLLFQKLHLFNKLSSDMAEHLQALERLSSGILEPSIISPAALDNVLNHITDHLQQNFPNVKLISTSKALYYSQADCVSVRIKNKILIMKKFPLTNWNQRFFIYQIKNFNIPISNNNSHATTLINLPAYVAISEDNEYYFPFDHVPIIKNEMLFLNSEPMENFNNTCIFALYKNDANKITKLCTSVFLPLGLKPSIIRLGVTKILLIQIPIYTLIFSNETQENYKGCHSFCIKTIPCGAMIKTESFLLPPKINGCGNETIQDITLFPINYALLSAFFQQNELQVFKSSMLLEKELDLVLPQIDFLKLNDSIHLEEDTNVKLNLNRLADSLSKDQVLFQNNIHALKYDVLTNFQNLEIFNYKSWRDILLSVTASIEIFYLLIIVVLFWKLHKLRILILLKTAHSTDGLRVTLPTQLIHHKLKTPQTTVTPTQTPNDFASFDLHFDLDNSTKIFQVLLFLIITILFVCIVYKLYSKNKYNKFDWKTRLYFHFASGSQIITLYGQDLADHFDKFTFSSENSITSVQLVGCLFPNLLMNWNVIIKHEFIPDPIHFQNSFRLNWYQAYLIRKVLKTHQKFLIIPFCKSGDGIPHAIEFSELNPNNAVTPASLGHNSSAISIPQTLNHQESIPLFHMANFTSTTALFPVNEVTAC